MLTKIRRRLAQEEGFTLIELLVVILIIGILAAVAIPTFLSQKNKATDSNAQSNLKNAQTVVESYADGNQGTYPTNTNYTTALSSVPGLSGDSDATSLGSGPNEVYYYNADTAASNPSNTSDTYAVAAEGDSSNPTWWAIVEQNGTTYYGVAQGSGANAQTAISNATTSSTLGSQSGFPSVTS